MREQRWAEMLGRCLQHLGKNEGDIRNDRKSAPWKAAVALRLKETSQAGNRWLSERLGMGRPEAVTVYVRRLQACGVGANRDYVRLTTIVSA